MGAKNLAVRSLGSFFFFLFFFFFVVERAESQPTVRSIRTGFLSKYTYCLIPSPGWDYWFFWTPSPDNDTIRFALSAAVEPDGYVGLGFNPTGIMPFSDLYISINPTSGSAKVLDYFANQERQVCAGRVGVCTDDQLIPPGRNNAITFNSSYVSGIFSVEFLRPIANVDANTDLVIKDGIVTLFAVGKRISGVFQQHDFTASFGGSILRPDQNLINNCIFTTPAPTPVGPLDMSSFRFSYQVNGVLKIYWTVNQTSKTIDFGLELQSSQGWAALAFSLDQSGNMVPSDAMVLSTPNAVLVDDYQLLDQDAGAYPDQNRGGKNDMFNVTGQRLNGLIQAKWSRAFITGDALDYSFDPSAPIKCVYGFSTSRSQIAKHDPSDRGTLTINFLTGEVTSSTDYRPAHGWLMWVAWSIMGPIGASLAKFLKKMGVWWFRLHIITLVLCLFLSVAGFGLIVNYKTTHFNNHHSRLGLAVFIMVCLQPILGVVADRMYDPNRDSVPIFPDRVHGVLGWAALILGMVNIWLGIDIFDAAKVYWILYGIQFAIVMLVLIVGGIIFEATNSGDGH